MESPCQTQNVLALDEPEDDDRSFMHLHGMDSFGFQDEIVKSHLVSTHHQTQTVQSQLSGNTTGIRGLKVEMTDRLEITRTTWNDFAVRFTETANKRMTLQCAQHLHSHMQLDCAQNVLEVAAGAGLGSLDIVQYLLEGRSKLPHDFKRTFTVTDLSPVMIGMAETNLSGQSSDILEIKCREANGKMILSSFSFSVFRPCTNGWGDRSRSDGYRDWFH